MPRDLSSTRTSESLCSQEWDHKEVSLKKDLWVCKLFCINLLYHLKDRVLCKMIMGKRKSWWIPLLGSIYFCACYENTVHISYWHTEWVLSWLYEFPYHFSSSSNIAVIFLRYKKGTSTWTKRQYILLKKQAMYQKKTQAYV